MKMKNAKIVRLAPLFLPLFTLGEIHGLPNRIASNPIALLVLRQIQFWYSQLYLCIAARNSCSAARNSRSAASIKAFLVPL
jgi:hypothetical protein